MMKSKLAGLGSVVLSILIGSIAFAGTAQQQPPKQTAPAQNQSGATSSASASDGFESMSKQLDLTADQKAKVKVLVDDRAKQWAALGKDKTINGKQKEAKMLAINQATDKEIEKVLAPQQRQKFHAIMEQGKPPSLKQKAPDGHSR